MIVDCKNKEFNILIIVIQCKGGYSNIKKRKSLLQMNEDGKWVIIRPKEVIKQQKSFCISTDSYEKLKDIKTFLKADYVWAFPFNYDYREDGQYAYLIHFNPTVADNLIGVANRFHFKESKFI